MALTNNVGPKIKTLLLKLQATHRKDNFNIFSESKQCLEVETSPKEVKVVKELLEYNTMDIHYKNVMPVLHIADLISFGIFRTKYLLDLR
eukprot:536911-Ditylum_brightwellii.AAC.1